MGDCYIGIMAYNEEKSIGFLLDSILQQDLHTAKIEKIYVVSSGSTDNTNQIVNSFVSKDPRIELIEQRERKGKANAINVFLNRVPENAICIVCSADLILSRDVVEKLYRAFDESDVGMATVRPIPINSMDSWIGAMVYLLWELKHEISLVYPKTGEVIAFRKMFDSIDEATLVDEAYIEMLVQKNGKKIVYVADAIVKNKGPQNISDFIKQRRRIYIGHKLLERQAGYRGSTFDKRLILKAAGLIIKKRPKMFLTFVLLIIIELYSRLLGTFDLFLGKYNRDGTWDMVETSKDLGG